MRLPIPCAVQVQGSCGATRMIIALWLLAGMTEARGSLALSLSSQKTTTTSSSQASWSSSFSFLRGSTSDYRRSNVRGSLHSQQQPSNQSRRRHLIMGKDQPPPPLPPTDSTPVTTNAPTTLPTQQRLVDVTSSPLVVPVVPAPAPVPVPTSEPSLGPVSAPIPVPVSAPVPVPAPAPVTTSAPAPTSTNSNSTNTTITNGRDTNTTTTPNQDMFSDACQAALHGQSLTTPYTMDLTYVYEVVIAVPTTTSTNINVSPEQAAALQVSRTMQSWLINTTICNNVDSGTAGLAAVEGVAFLQTSHNDGQQRFLQQKTNNSGSTSECLFLMAKDSNVTFYNLTSDNGEKPVEQCYRMQGQQHLYLDRYLSPDLSAAFKASLLQQMQHAYLLGALQPLPSSSSSTTSDDKSNVILGQFAFLFNESTNANSLPSNSNTNSNDSPHTSTQKGMKPVGVFFLVLLLLILVSMAVFVYVTRRKNGGKADGDDGSQVDSSHVEYRQSHPLQNPSKGESSQKTAQKGTQVWFHNPLYQPNAVKAHEGRLPPSNTTMNNTNNTTMITNEDDHDQSDRSSSVEGMTRHRGVTQKMVAYFLLKWDSLRDWIDTSRPQISTSGHSTPAASPDADQQHPRHFLSDRYRKKRLPSVYLRSDDEKVSCSTADEVGTEVILANLLTRDWKQVDLRKSLVNELKHASAIHRAADASPTVDGSDGRRTLSSPTTTVVTSESMSPGQVSVAELSFSEDGAPSEITSASSSTAPPPPRINSRMCFPRCKKYAPSSPEEFPTLKELASLASSTDHVDYSIHDSCSTSTAHIGNLSSRKVKSEVNTGAYVDEKDGFNVHPKMYSTDLLINTSACSSADIVSTSAIDDVALGPSPNQEDERNESVNVPNSPTTTSMAASTTTTRPNVPSTNTSSPTDTLPPSDEEDNNQSGRHCIRPSDDDKIEDDAPIALAQIKYTTSSSNLNRGKHYISQKYRTADTVQL